MLDNATFHKSKHLHRIGKENNVELLYLPPYSPELNPIEKLWANLKQFWRNHCHLSLVDMIIASNFVGE